jgi:membrane protein
MASAYGAAGALIVMLLWVYYSAQIFLLGAEFTKAYSDRAKSDDSSRA